MNIKDHGLWVPYKPAQRPEGWPFNTLFARRESDGIDWYEYLQDGHFTDGSIKITVYGDLVGTATTDETRLWPGDKARVLEVFDVNVDDPLKLFLHRRYDATRQEFVEVQ